MNLDYSKMNLMMELAKVDPVMEDLLSRAYEYCILKASPSLIEATRLQDLEKQQKIDEMEIEIGYLQAELDKRIEHELMNKVYGF